MLLLALGNASLCGQSLKIVSLNPPQYPPIALAARVSGEVNLKITILENGTTEGVEVLSGPPMLLQTAIDSARGSTFVFNRDNHSGNSYQLTYKYILKVLDCDQAPDSSYPQAQYDSNIVMITGQAIPLCDPGGVVRVRSIRCLYVWRCRTK
jgi:TonB family protein